MKHHLAYVSLLVNDYDQAIQFYVNKLKFVLVEDTPISNEKRWVVVRPYGSQCALVLVKATAKKQLKFVGNQTGGKVFLFIYTDDIEQDIKWLILQQVKIVRFISSQPYGLVAVFEDLYGNLWDLIQPIDHKNNRQEY